jgi:hypothetical protein
MQLDSTLVALQPQLYTACCIQAAESVFGPKQLLSIALQLMQLGI